MKYYEFKFDFWALLLFITIMIPNFIWFFIPAPHDVLRVESVTPAIDILSSIFQVLMIATMIFFNRKESRNLQLFHPWTIITILLAILYYMAWGFYYLGFVSILVIMSICLLPCFSLMAHSINRKNIPALLFGIIFSSLHLVFGVINFLS